MPSELYFLNLHWDKSTQVAASLFACVYKLKEIKEQVVKSPYTTT